MNELDLLIKYPLPSFSCFNLLKGPSVMSLVSYFFFFLVDGRRIVKLILKNSQLLPQPGEL